MVVVDWNFILLGLMWLMLLEGDVVFVNWLVYDFKLLLIDFVLLYFGEL